MTALSRKKEKELSQHQASKLIAEQVARFNSSKMRNFAAEAVAKRAEKLPVKVVQTLCWGCNQHEANDSGYCDSCRSGKETETNPVKLRSYATATAGALAGIVLLLLFIWSVGL